MSSTTMVRQFATFGALEASEGIREAIFARTVQLETEPGANAFCELIIIMEYSRRLIVISTQHQ